MVIIWFSLTIVAQTPSLFLYPNSYVSIPTARTITAGGTSFMTRYSYDSFGENYISLVGDFTVNSQFLLQTILVEDLYFSVNLHVNLIQNIYNNWCFNVHTGVANLVYQPIADTLEDEESSDFGTYMMTQFQIFKFLNFDFGIAHRLFNQESSLLYGLSFIVNPVTLILESIENQTNLGLNLALNSKSNLVLTYNNVGTDNLITNLAFKVSLNPLSFFSKRIRSMDQSFDEMNISKVEMEEQTFDSELQFRHSNYDQILIYTYLKKIDLLMDKKLYAEARSIIKQLLIKYPGRASLELRLFICNLNDISLNQLEFFTKKNISMIDPFYLEFYNLPTPIFQFIQQPLLDQLMINEVDFDFMTELYSKIKFQISSLIDEVEMIGDQDSSLILYQKNLLFNPYDFGLYVKVIENYIEKKDFEMALTMVSKAKVYLSDLYYSQLQLLEQNVKEEYVFFNYENAIKTAVLDNNFDAAIQLFEEMEVFYKDDVFMMDRLYKSFPNLK